MGTMAAPSGRCTPPSLRHRPVFGLHPFGSWRTAVFKSISAARVIIACLASPDLPFKNLISASCSLGAPAVAVISRSTCFQSSALGVCARRRASLFTRRAHSAETHFSSLNLALRPLGLAEERRSHLVIVSIVALEGVE